MKESAPWSSLFDPELHYFVEKSLSLVSVLNQTNQSRTLLAHFVRLHFRHHIAVTKLLLCSLFHIYSMPVP